MIDVEQYARQLETGQVDPELRREVLRVAWVGRMYVEVYGPDEVDVDMVGNVEGIPAWSEVTGA